MTDGSKYEGEFDGGKYNGHGVYVARSLPTVRSIVLVVFRGVEGGCSVVADVQVQQG